ncbi:MAG TPA: nitronate monooxygenase [Paracoccus sp. (in: a-proteobacteria)]|uniref:NAD(P)H-dependent flavin oxidoreductase n=1 Tax=uncultured Paracoccus sp. TaxID=189685 RepID=UPI00261BD93D|nr:nitronate monooxygenase [uncultured Paracoccus sp.]HMQ40559.1 nitronate monooxygenase [Paracoccus sp. (in: a-proteobacteria)]HMR34657.1 nitronate monooxygenase [Paracoccus sp. (in: a-proteobacteria)]
MAETKGAMMLLERIGMRVPVVQAPMAGVTTPALAAAVANAGGLGSLGVAAMDAARAGQEVRATRALTSARFNVNVFCHRPPRRDAAKEKAWLDSLAPDFARFGAAPPEMLSDGYRPFADDPEMLAMLLAERPGVVSFHFGLPAPEQLAALRDSGAVLLGSATNIADALAIEAAGLDGIVAQGWQAGGHRGVTDENAPDARLETLPLLSALKDIGLPLIAAGGIMSRTDVQAALDAGAVAAQCGTAFLVADEAGTSAPHRAALTAGRTRMTRAISGRPARGVENLISSRGDSAAPDYPLPYSALKALHGVASKAGEYGYGPFWAGTECARARSGTAAEILSRLAP